MGKHKKFLRSEKAKVKLKGTKLKEAQNVTKTDFKVRKIIITEQLKNVQEAGVRKKHNVNDCITRLKNSSSAEAISNLKEVILYQQDDFQRNIEVIIKTVANLSLSLEKVDRKESFKLLDLICSNTRENVLKPFLHILVTYFKCALTHIKPAIQEDSLLMLDILLKYAREIISSEKDNLLTPYLDMVSKMKTENNSAAERSLSLQMGNKITSIKWRINVLQRLITFLKCINEQSEGNVDNKSDIKTVDVREKQQYINNPYINYHHTSIPISLYELANGSNAVKVNETKSVNHVDMIMPLMFETWIELKDSKTSSISFDNSVILKLIMDTIMELYSMIENDEIAKQKFFKKYQDRFEKQILSDFPYTTHNFKSNKINNSGGEKCIYQNLTIAVLYLPFAMRNQQRFWKYREKIFDFVEECIINWRTKDQEFISCITRFINILFHSKELRKIFSSESKKIFNELVKKCNIDQTSFDIKLALVCEIIEHNGNDFSCESIITQMINFLAEKEAIPFPLIKTLSSVVKRGNQTISSELTKCALEIVKNVMKTSTKIISGNLNDSERIKTEDLVNIFYWINVSDEFVTFLNENENHLICKRIKELINTKCLTSKI